MTSDKSINKYISRNCRVYVLESKAPWLVKDIANILISENAVCLEINHTPKFINNPQNIEFLSNYFKVGIHFHHKASHEALRAIGLSKYAYKIVNSEKHIDDFGLDSVIVRNSIQENMIFDMYHNNRKKKKKCLVVSRLDKDKLNSIESAVSFLIKKTIDFEVAGESVYGDSVVGYLKNKYSLPQEKFIGSINTYDYLSRNVDEYLFVAGIGQVVIEAGALGFPVLCADILREPSFFSVNNYVDSLKSNLVTIAENNIRDFDEHVIACHSVFSLCACIAKYNSLEDNFKKYYEVVK